MRLVLTVLAASLAPTIALAQAAQPNVYALGELVVTARSPSGETIGGSVIGHEALTVFNRNSLDQAMALAPGVAASNTGGSRNERLIYVRGFDRFQTTLSIDGVRVFLPADNRIDFARFLTADLSEIQISKGYVSVLDGPGGLGGAINLVTIKPTRALEGEVRAALFTDRELNNDARLVSARLGGAGDTFYWQASGAWQDRSSFTLSKRFKPTSLEDGGERVNSQSEDWRINLKAGWHPNATDEYSLNYTRSEGEKNAPYSVSDTANTRFWSWPHWNTDTLALLTRTQVADGVTLKTRLYRNSFDNLLSAFDTAAQTTQSLPRAFNSYYRDHAYGGNATVEWKITDASRLTGAFYARRDVHHERQNGFVRTPAAGNPSANAPYFEPEQTNDEWTYSAAAEYAQSLGVALELVAGVSYDWTDLKVANDANVVVTGATIATSVISFAPVNYALKDNEAWNGQAALVWRANDGARVHLSVSSRARFPTVFERFSSRMGAAIPNPDVKAERATNVELGFDTQAAAGVTLKGAVFHSNLRNALIQIPVFVTGFGTVNQTKNAAKGEYYGAETEAQAVLTPSVDVGGNVSYIHRKLTDPTNAAFRPQGVPSWKAFAYANWRPTPRLTLRPNVEYADERWTATTAAPIVFYRTGSYFLVNVSADYALSEQLTVSVAGQNLGDQTYQLTDGFPEAGRTFIASLRARF